MARQLAGAVAATGAVVVSGLARGIDGHAHRGALVVGRTVAVLGHGLAFTSPLTHLRLRDDILRSGGAVLTGFPDEQAPARWTFPRRNLWIAGLSKAVVVVEAPESSGALITAQQALNIGREVWAVPGRVGHPSAVGCLKLIHQGAGIVADIDQFASQFGSVRAERTPDDWLTLLFAGHTVDQVSRWTNRSVSDLLANLGAMETTGEVVRLPGGRYAWGGSPR
jgi:DNA processing protein